MEEKIDILKIMVLDDEKDAVIRMENLLEKIPYDTQVFSFTDPKNAVEKAKSILPDLMFVDVEMPGMSGFDVVREIQRMQIPVTVIFVTAFDQYAIKAIRNAAFDYLLKPVDVDELRETFTRYLENPKKKIQPLVSTNYTDKIRFSTRTGYIYIDPYEIIWCEARGAYTKLHLKESDNHIVSLYLRKVQEELPAKQFYRISRSAIINTNYLHFLNRKDKTVTLSVNNTTYTLKASIKYLKGLME